jgi:hypothetical protein
MALIRGHELRVFLKVDVDKSAIVCNSSAKMAFRGGQRGGGIIRAKSRLNLAGFRWADVGKCGRNGVFDAGNVSNWQMAHRNHVKKANQGAKCG